VAPSGLGVDVSLRFHDIKEEHGDSSIALRFFALEDAYQTSITQSLGLALAFHALLALAGGVIVDLMRIESSEVVTIGYEGPTRTLEELEIIEPNSVQSYFFQRERTGVMAAPEYSITEPLELDPGPEPVPVRQIKKDVEMPKVREVPQEVELIEPLKAYHKPTTQSASFTIIKAVKPFYPEYEEQRSIRAKVTVAFYLTADGRIQNEHILEVETDPPNASTLAFELSTLEAVRQWRIRPAAVDGEPRGQWIPFLINFDVDGVSSLADPSW
jgi:TonB family protein